MMCSAAQSLSLCTLLISLGTVTSSRPCDASAPRLRLRSCRGLPTSGGSTGPVARAGGVCTGIVSGTFSIPTPSISCGEAQRSRRGVLKDFLISQQIF
ncbi:hypothetical protein B0H12DRAFT_1113658 [Mycena haematopus]|nr:hypothetical protein B0H12DRAFT_1113658 [Mycena haematopus]